MRRDDPQYPPAGVPCQQADAPAGVEAFPPAGALAFGSVCSGIEAASVAWEPLGWRCAFMSEIEAFPRAVLAHRFPRVPLRGDFTQIQAGEHDAIDVLIGGTPCQSFSVAGLRKGLADERGNLALEYLRLADRLRPRWLVWENVPGVLSSNGGRDFGAFLGGLGELGYGFAYRVLDAQHFGVPQRRRRVFVVGCAGDWRRAAAVLFEPHSMQGHPPPRREAGERVADCLTVGANQCSGSPGDFVEHDVARCLTAHPSRIDGESETFIAHTLRADGFDASEDGTGRGTPLVPVAFAHQQGGSIDLRMSQGMALTLQRSQGQAVAFHENQRGELTTNDTDGSLKVGGGKPGQGYPAVQAGMAVRRLTPRECERLQGFPDDYTLIPWRSGMAADGPRYKALGNSMAVPVMAWIGRRIERVSRRDAMEAAA